MKEKIYRRRKEEIEDVSLVMILLVVTLLGVFAIKAEAKESQTEVQEVQEVQDVQEALALYFQEKEQIKEKLISVDKLLEEKFSGIHISEDMDMSKPLGLTTEELEYILKNAKRKNGELFIQDQKTAEEIALAITLAVEKYPLNELFILAVMSFETGYFTSDYVQKYNNFGGMQVEGEPIVFETRQEGLEAAIKCIHSNLKGNNTVYEVNETYCEPMGDDIYGWAKNVLSIMKTYASVMKIE